MSQPEGNCADPSKFHRASHGARSVLARVKRDKHSFGEWLNKLEARAPQNVAFVAMANKLACIFRHDDYYEFVTGLRADSLMAEQVHPACLEPVLPYGHS